jgi:predicted nucleic acid-binding protein
MTTVVYTNVLVALWDRDDALNSAAQAALDTAVGRGRLVVPAPVFAELLAGPGRSELFLDSFFLETGMVVDWELGEEVWRAAGRAFARYLTRAGKPRIAGPRRILADFLIGAYSFENSYNLLTLDDRLYRSAFPHLKLLPV